MNDSLTIYLNILGWFPLLVFFHDHDNIIFHEHGKDPIVVNLGAISNTAFNSPVSSNFNEAKKNIVSIYNCPVSFCFK